MRAVNLPIEALRHAVASLPEDRLAPVRRAALEHLGQHGLPTPREEDWKYTDLGPAVEIGNEWLAGGAVPPEPAGMPAAGREVLQRIEADWIVIADGRVDAAALGAFTGADVQVSLLSESDVPLDFAAPLTDLNSALLRDGLRIGVRRGAVVERPIGLMICDTAESAAGMSQVRIEIELEAGSRAEFIEYHASAGAGRHYANTVVNLRLARDTHASYVRIQDRDRAHVQTGQLNVRLGSASAFEHAAFDFGGRLVRNDLNVGVDAAGASASLAGLYLVGQDQHADNHVRVDHRVGPARSRQDYRGILNGKARAVWNGKVIVHAGADGTDADQANHNLLLSKQAEIDAKPELEIYADDVKCSHGTTVGELDTASLYYLRTRGLDEEEARQVLMRAFAQAIVDRTPVAVTRELLAEKMAGRLAGLLEGMAP
ncbi:MAG: Fe-S cluster assembly protein SufD [Woeseiaceae bacterium]